MFKHTIHDDEQLLRVYRKHELTLSTKIIQVFVLLFVPWYFGIKYDFIFSAPLNTKLFIFWTLLVAMYALYAFLVWSVNIYIITTKRLVHISHSGIFKKTVNETPLDRILNVSFRTTGFFSTLFHYGDVLVQIVGLDQPLVLKDVPSPSDVKDFIWKIHLSGGEQKITYTKPEIAPVQKDIIYAPHIEQKTINKPKRSV